MSGPHVFEPGDCVVCGKYKNHEVHAALLAEPVPLDVERLRQAFMNTPTGKVRRKRIPTDEGTFWNSVAAEYARLTDHKAER